MSQETLNLPLPDEGEQGPYTLIGKARAKPGCEDALEQHLLALVEPTRREAGVLAYHIHKDRLDRSCFVFYEVWRSLEALKWHLAQPYIQAFLQERHLYLDGDLDIVWLRMCSPYAAAGCGPANPVQDVLGAQDEIEIRPVREEDAPILATLLNEIIARGGTTALEEPLTASALADTMLTGPDVLCCFVAVERGTGLLLGFQSLERHDQLPDDRGDIATFARVGLTQKGVGGALFAATRQRARELGLTAINATIRSDNHGGLTFYSRMGFVDYDIQRAIPLKDGKLVDRIQKLYRLQDA